METKIFYQYKNKFYNTKAAVLEVLSKELDEVQPGQAMYPGIYVEIFQEDYAEQYEEEINLSALAEEEEKSSDNTWAGLVKAKGIFLRPMDMGHGWGNGYVVLGKNHPLYGVHYNKINYYPHGGLTFSEEYKKNDRWCAELLEENIYMAKGQKLEDGDWLLGFDTNHLGDNIGNCPREYVLDQATKMSNELSYHYDIDKFLEPRFYEDEEVYDMYDDPSLDQSLEQ